LKKQARSLKTQASSSKVAKKQVSASGIHKFEKTSQMFENTSQ